MRWHWNYFNTLQLLWVELNFQQKSLILLLDFWASKDKSKAKWNNSENKKEKKKENTTITNNKKNWLHQISESQY